MPAHERTGFRTALAAVLAGLAIVPPAVVAAVAATQPPALRTAAAAAPDGAALFDVHCIACHGPDARGIDNLGVDLVASPFVARSAEPDLVGFLKDGRLPDDPDSLTGRPMPGFAWVAEGELRALAAFLKSRNGKG